MLGRYKDRFENVCKSNGHVTLVTVYSSAWLGGTDATGRAAAELLMRWTALMYHIYHMLSFPGGMDEF